MKLMLCVDTFASDVARGTEGRGGGGGGGAAFVIGSHDSVEFGTPTPIVAQLVHALGSQWRGSQRIRTRVCSAMYMYPL